MEIAARLRQLGFPSNYVGFPYLACAISLVQTEPEYLYQVFKCLYPAVATAFQTSAACVERDIRTLLCWILASSVFSSLLARSRTRSSFPW